MTEDRDATNPRRPTKGAETVDSPHPRRVMSPHRAMFPVLVLGVLGCQNETPTDFGGDLVPTTPTTVEIDFDYQDFATGLALYGGYGNKNAFRFGGVLSYVAHDFEAAALNARTLIRFGGPPRGVVVQDTTGATVTDSTLTFLGGSMLVIVDTLQSTVSGATEIEFASLRTRWSSTSAGWTLAIDSVGESVPWGGPGADPADPVAVVTWDPAQALDTIRVTIDSATVARWTDTTDLTRGVRLSSGTSGSLVAVRGVALSVRARPASNPDTVVAVAVGLEDQTFIYDPQPQPRPGDIWVGGAPAWRTVFTMSVPETLDGPPELCAAVGCPLTLDPDFVTSATILLNTAPSPGSFQPTDTITMIALPVLAPERLPKSPLGAGFTDGVRLLPSYFGATGGIELRLPITEHVKALLSEPADGEAATSPTIALLALSEPSSLGLAAFAGPDGDTPPRLRLVLTIPQTVGLR